MLTEGRWFWLPLVVLICTIFAVTSDFTDDMDEDLREYMSEHGVSNIEFVLKKTLMEWRELPLNIAVTGNSGTGKSSFINAIRGLTGDDEGAAEVGVTETTSKPTPYAHPSNPHLKFWDLPGIGTLDFPKDEYLKRVEFRKYDCFLIFASERFRESDAWLARQIHHEGKKFYFVRAKIDLDIENDKKAHPKTTNTANVLRKVRNNCEDNLRRAGISNPDIFILSNHYPERWDFPALSTRLIDDLPIRKREAMIYSLRALTFDQVKQKRKTLESRKWKVAAVSGLGAAVPVPGLSVAVDVGLILYEANFYLQVFGLDEASLRSLARATGMEVDSLISKIAYPTVLNYCSQQGITKLLVSYGPMALAEEYLRYVPFVGSAIAGSLSYQITMSALTTILDEMQKNALEVVRMAIENTTEKRHFYPKTEL